MTRAVIIPAYKAGWCLDDCIQSIGQQTIRPNRILIGCDACPESAEKALQLKAKFAKTSRRHHRIIVDVYWFAPQVGPYRIRNTLAVFASTDILHFFDADDLMADEYIETMEKVLTPFRFIWPFATMRNLATGEDDKDWTRAHGLLSIYRNTFLMHGGFMPWPCGADTEAHQRWEHGGLQRMTTSRQIAVVRKHAEGLTLGDELGYKSKVRKRVKAKIAQRRKSPARCASIGVGSCWRIEDMADIDANHDELPALPYPDSMPHDTKDYVDVKALQHIRNLLAVFDTGFDKSKRKVAYKAAAYLEQNKTR